jgi:EDD domain protein, DegV family
MRIRISADSTCDLSPELVEQYGVAITPLYIRLGDRDLKDTLEVTRDDIFSYVQKTKSIPKTSAVNVGDYTEFFRKTMDEGYDGVVHFTISADMSSCYQNACLAAQQFKNVYIVDSRTLSSGIGHLVLDACILRDEGKTAKEIFDASEARKEKLDVSFVIDTLRYLALGGRCNSLLAFGANLLNIKPSIQVRDGKMGVDKNTAARWSARSCATSTTSLPIRIRLT